MRDTTANPAAALAIAISAFAAIGLFWALILVFILLDQGPAILGFGTRASALASHLKLGALIGGGGLTALFALFVSVGSLWFTRRHNRLSVRPRVSIVRIVENNDNKKKGLYLRNHGLGPALIDEIIFEVKSDGKVFNAYESFRDFVFSEYRFVRGDLGVYWLDLLPKDATERVLWLEDDEADDEFKALLFDVRMKVRYSSFYGEHWEEVYEMSATVA